MMHSFILLVFTLALGACSVRQIKPVAVQLELIRDKKTSFFKDSIEECLDQRGIGLSSAQWQLTLKAYPLHSCFLTNNETEDVHDSQPTSARISKKIIAELKNKKTGEVFERKIFIESLDFDCLMNPSREDLQDSYLQLCDYDQSKNEMARNLDQKLAQVIADWVLLKSLDIN